MAPLKHDIQVSRDVIERLRNVSSGSLTTELFK
jgi:hypothetical protein